jgi:hypothetical protein
MRDSPRVDHTLRSLSMESSAVYCHEHPLTGLQTVRTRGVRGTLSGRTGGILSSTRRLHNANQLIDTLIQIPNLYFIILSLYLTLSNEYEPDHLVT